MNAAERDASAKELLSAIETSDVAAFCVMDYWTFDGYLLLVDAQKRGIATTSKKIFPGMELRLEAPTAFRLNTHVLLSDAVDTDALAHFIAQLRIGGAGGKPPSSQNFIALAREYDDAKLRAHGCSPEDRRDDAKMHRLGQQTALVTRESLKAAMAVVGEDKCLLVQPYDTSDGLEGLDWKEHSYDDVICFSLFCQLQALQLCKLIFSTALG